MKYGLDVSTYPDMDGSGVNIDSDSRVLLEQLWRSYSTDPTLLDYVDADACIDLATELSKGRTPGEQKMLLAKLESIAEKDERVLRAQAVGRFDEQVDIRVNVTVAGGRTLALAISGTPSDLKVLQSIA